jgi:hypothetical protein
MAQNEGLVASHAIDTLFEKLSRLLRAADETVAKNLPGLASHFFPLLARLFLARDAQFLANYSWGFDRSHSID